MELFLEVVDCYTIGFLAGIIVIAVATAISSIYKGGKQ